MTQITKKITYTVDGIEFKSEKEAKAYVNKINLQNARFKKGDVVYVVRKKKCTIEKRKVSYTEVYFGKVYYYLENYNGDHAGDNMGVCEDAVYASLDEYFEYLKTSVINCID